jgi:hypothetical protein
MGTLVHMKPKLHEEMKVGKTKAPAKGTGSSNRKSEKQ